MAGRAIYSAIKGYFTFLRRDLPPQVEFITCREKKRSFRRRASELLPRFLVLPDFALAVIIFIGGASHQQTLSGY